MWSGTHAFIRPPVVLGHEIVGMVEEVGDNATISPGSTVTIFPPIGCGMCFHCCSGHQQLCEKMEFFGGQRSGGFADYLLAPSSHVIEIPEDVPTELQVLIEPASVAVHGVARSGLGRKDRCVVLGAGPIGLLTALVLREHGAEQVVVGDVVYERRCKAEQAGFETFDPSAQTVIEAVAERIRPEGADVVFECVGSQQTIAQALEATRKGGKAVIVGNAPPTVELDGLALQRGDRSLVGVLMYDLDDFRTTMRLLAAGLLDAVGARAGELVAHYDLTEIAQAFSDAKEGRLVGLKAAVKL
jgi:L-iditol 2-dehydrogenase